MSNEVSTPGMSVHRLSLAFGEAQLKDSNKDTQAARMAALRDQPIHELTAFELLQCGYTEQ